MKAVVRGGAHDWCQNRHKPNAQSKLAHSGGQASLAQPVTILYATKSLLTIGQLLRVLALETSTVAGSVAALSGSDVMASLRLNPSQRGAQSLAPALSQLLGQAGWKPRDVELVAVSVGPGSFTALRVGVTTAKTFAYVVGADVIAVDTLEVVAAQVAVAVGETVATAIDAQRGEVYAARYRTGESGNLECVEPAAIVASDKWLAGLASGIVVAGPAIDKLILPDRLRVAPREIWWPTAVTVGQLAVAKHAAGQRDDVWSLVPRYLRRSAAEEKAERTNRR